MESRMNHRQRIMTMLCFITILGGCDNPVRNSPDTSVILPLHIGNSWTYRAVDIAANGDTIRNAIDTAVVAASQTIGSGIFFRISNLPVSVGMILSWHITQYANKDFGLIGIVEPDKIIVGPPPPLVVDTVLLYPTKVGDEHDLQRFKVRTAAKNLVVQTSVGTFQAYQYDVFSDTSLVTQIWMAPNIGIVKSWQRFGFAQSYRFLISYQVKP